MANHGLEQVQVDGYSENNIIKMLLNVPLLFIFYAAAHASAILFSQSKWKEQTVRVH